MISTGPRSSVKALVLAKASLDPRNSINGLHHVVLERFDTSARQVSLRHFAWEKPDAHRYQDTSHACALSTL